MKVQLITKYINIQINSIILILFFQTLYALPRFALQEGASCNLCHVNPTGGSLRNDYGTAVFSLEELPMQTMQKFGNDDWDGFVSDYLRIGGDFRIQGLNYKTNNEQKTAFFPMQADLYTTIEINEKAEIFYKVSLGQNNPEYWTLLSLIPNEGWLKIGKTLPNYGLKLDDHTSFIRGGNLNRTQKLKSLPDSITNVKTEGLIFTPWVNLPAIIEVGYDLTNQISITSSLANGFINGSNEDLENINLTTRLNIIHTIYNYFNITGVVSYMQESDFQLTGISGGISAGDIMLSGEIDRAINWPDGITALASYGELNYQFKQGIHFVGKYDFFDPDLDWMNGAISRYTLGIEIFPLNILEVKLQSRFTQLDLDDVEQPEPEFLIQFHTWF